MGTQPWYRRFPLQTLYIPPCLKRKFIWVWSFSLWRKESWRRSIKATWTETKDIYYQLSDDPEVAAKILAEFGIDSQRAAAEYLKGYARRQEAVPAYMRVLGLGDRPDAPPPAPAESLPER